MLSDSALLSQTTVTVQPIILRHTVNEAHDARPVQYPPDLDIRLDAQPVEIEQAPEQV